MIVYYGIILKNGESRQFYETSERMREGHSVGIEPWARCLHPQNLGGEIHLPYRLQDIESIVIKAVHSGFERYLGTSSLRDDKDPSKATFDQLPKEWKEIAKPAFALILAQDGDRFVVNVLEEQGPEDPLTSEVYPSIYEWAQRIASAQGLDLAAAQPTIAYNGDRIDSMLRSNIYGFFRKTVPSLKDLAKEALPYGVAIPAHLDLPDEIVEEKKNECSIM